MKPGDKVRTPAGFLGTIYGPSLSDGAVAVDLENGTRYSYWTDSLRLIEPAESTLDPERQEAARERAEAKEAEATALRAEADALDAAAAAVRRSWELPEKKMT